MCFGLPLQQIQMDLEKVYEFVERMCVKYCIDESHDVSHSKDCVHFATELMPVKVSEDVRTVILFAAAVHDTVDKKYTSFEAVNEVREFFQSIHLPTTLINAIVDIITTMSYSFLVSRRKESLSFPDHGEWEEAYHIVRNADLLCSFRVKRCFQYQKHLTPEISDNEAMKKVADLFRTRVFAYEINGWLTIDKARSLSTSLRKKAHEDLILI